MDVELALRVQIRAREETAPSGEGHLGAASSGQFAQCARDRRLLCPIVEGEHATLADAVETGLHLGKERLARAALLLDGRAPAEHQHRASALAVPARPRCL